MSTRFLRRETRPSRCTLENHKCMGPPPTILVYAAMVAEEVGVVLPYLIKNLNALSLRMVGRIGGAFY